MQGEAVLGLEAAARAVVSPGHARAQPRVGRVRQGLRLLADGPRRGAARDRGGLRRGHRPRPRWTPTSMRIPSIRMVSVVHSETPSGTLNPVREIGPIAAAPRRGHHRGLCRSFGGIELQAEAWQLDLLVAGPQKCLGGPPGMSLMAVSAAGLGGHRREPRRAAGLVPVHARLARHVARQGSLPVHAVGVRPARRPGGGGGAARGRTRRRSRRATPGSRAPCWAGVRGDGPARCGPRARHRRPTA